MIIIPFARTITVCGRLRPPSRLKMNSLRSALTAASPAKNTNPSGRKEKMGLSLKRQSLRELRLHKI
jgi:hypothetical protein